jgi:sialic acid synthase SpsE
MKIGNLDIGPGHRPIIIAEIGINHNGNLETAKTMVKKAIDSGADIIKHQTHIVEDEMTDEAKKVIPPNDPRSIWQIMKDTSLSLEDEIELKKFTETNGGVYISTPFSRAAATFLNEIGVPAFKIGSGECSNLPLVRHIASFGKPIIMSTGMHSIEQFRPAVDIFIENNIPYCLLECTNLYPSPPENVSLNGIIELRQAFPGSIIGFSDHSIGPYMALASVALGASVIERHFTDSRYRVGPDIINSMDPSELRIIKDISQEIFVSTNNKKTRTVEEEGVYKFARSSVVADRDINVGEIISEDKIWARRPGTGEISGEEFDKVIGKKLICSLKKNDQLKWSYFE